MSPTIGFTYDLKSDHAPDAGVPEDALAEFDREEVINETVAALEAGGYKVVRIGSVRNLLRLLPNLGVDIVFNICEGKSGRNREAEVPVILDLYNIPYVGSDGLTLSLTLDKVMAKKVFISDGVLTPKYFVANRAEEKLLRGVKFPLIVKPLHEGSSKGISEDSIVKDRPSLWHQVKWVSRVYRQPALVEEFIHGGEFTVLVIGNQAPLALPPVQISIAGKMMAGDQVYTSRRVTNDEIRYVCPSEISKSLDKKLRDAAVAAYRSAGCRDFGRVDLRTDKKQTPYVLEINPLPSLSTEDVFPLIARAQGWTFEKLLGRIIEFGLERYGLN